MTTSLPVPLGWFQVAWSAELEPGACRPLRYFGRHLVLWRDHNGTAHLHDAFCPHLGTHLGHGGRVRGRSLVCPSHGWAFGAGGELVAVPGGGRVAGPCRLRAFPVVERNGLVLAWHHPTDDPPAWEVPTVPEVDDDPDHLLVGTREFLVDAPWQEMAENGADCAHFGFVHGQETVPAIDRYETDGPIARMRSTQRWPTAGGPVDALVEATSYGPGVSLVRMTGIIDTVSLGCNTPIDRGRCHLRFTFAVRRSGSDELTDAVGAAFVDLLTEQIGEDARVWEHKEFRARPALADTDGPIMQFRAWAAQFYPG